MGGVMQNKQRILLYLIESLSGINKFINLEAFRLAVQESAEA
jgi:hypothetical protein